MRDVFPALRGTGEGLSILVLAVSQGASIQNDQHAKAVHLGAVCPSLLPYPFRKRQS